MNNTDLAAALEARVGEITRDYEMAGDLNDNRHYGALLTAYGIAIGDLRGSQPEIVWLSCLTADDADVDDVSNVIDELDDFVAGTVMHYGRDND